MGVRSTLSVLKASAGVKPKHYFLFSFIKINGFLMRLSLGRKKGRVLESPVFLIGHLRSGTTFMHRLLGAADSLYSMKMFYMLFGNGKYGRLVNFILGKKLKKLSLDKMYDPKIHKTGFDLAETDDIAIYFNRFKGLLYWIYFEAWRKFKNENELKSSIKSAIDVKDILDFQSNLYHQCSVGSKRILSKSFLGLFHLEDLLKRHHNPKVILLTRKPEEVVASTLSLEISIQRNLNSFDQQPKSLQERYIQNIYQEVLMYYQKIDEIKRMNYSEVLVVDHKSLFDDFDASMDKILQFTNLTDDEALNKRIRTQSKAQKEFTSSHQYDLEEFGINSEALKMDFGPYYDYRN